MTAAAFPDRSSMVAISASRIHPSSAPEETTTRPPAPPVPPGRGGSISGGDAGRAPVPAMALHHTVWMRSSMGFHGTDGFSVYDAAGALVFRVDNYSRRRKVFAGELLLMDGQGAPLLALRPQIFSMHDQWNCYTASEEGQGKSTRPLRLFSMRKCSVLQKGHEAEVSMSGSCSTSFWVEGCFRRRSCKIRNSDGEEVARITRKKSNSLTLGDDVFSLVVQPGVDCVMIMAFVVVLDRICWKPYTPLICS
ncbi:protein LURP-one-related 5-like [Miscanthus floridulus]|uniref:protein LURP-one-related 5-like n=1 Tax=Miscanthus floridulus TaxID=154761 RepID=UPI00345B3F8F